MSLFNGLVLQTKMENETKMDEDSLNDSAEMNQELKEWENRVRQTPQFNVRPIT